MDKRKVYGHYIVGQGRDFRVKEPKNGIGVLNTLQSEVWYVVHINGRVLGAYHDETFANTLAYGLDQRDQKMLADEMEKILREGNH